MMTLEEHQARAMLMGRVYDWRDHTYCTTATDDGRPVAPMIDADTFEELEGFVSTARRQAWGTMVNWTESPMTHLNPKLPRKVME